MPRLPDVLEQARPVPTPSGGVASVDPSGGKGLASLSNTFGSVSKDYGEAMNLVISTNERQDQIVAQSAVNKLTEIGTLLQVDPKTGFNNVKGGDAANQEFADTYLQRFTDAKDALEKSLTSETQKRLFGQRAEVTALHYKSALFQHQSAQTNAFNDKTASDTMELGRRSIFQNPNDPSAVASGLAQIEWGIQQKAKQQGWNKTITDETRAQYLEKVYSDSVALEVEKNPRAALLLLNQRVEGKMTGSHAVDSLEPSKLIELRRRAAAYVTREEASARSDEDKRDAIAVKAYNELQAFALSGAMPSPEYEAQVKAAVAGTTHEANANLLLSKALIGASFGAQTLPRQQDMLKQWAAENSNGTDPGFVALHKQAQAINQTQTKAYTDNPWDAWTQFGRGPVVKTEPMSAPGSAAKVVATRLQAQTALEAVTGFTVSPLKADEAAEWAGALSALPPEAKAKELGAVGDQLSAPRLKALADQIDGKDKPTSLSLKLGADQTTAGRNVSVLVLRGAQAMKDKTVKADDAALAGWKANIAPLVRGVLGDPRAEDDVIDAAFYVRAAMEQDGINVEGFKLGASEEKAVSLVIGKPVERNGVRMLLPRGMSEKDFNEKLSNFTPEALSGIAPSGNVYLRGQPIPLQRFSSSLTNYGLKMDENGSFIPSVGGAFITLDPAGQRPIRLPIK